MKSQMASWEIQAQPFNTLSTVSVVFDNVTSDGWSSEGGAQRMLSGTF